VLIHTEVDERFEGHGLGGRLVSGALDDVRARGLHAAPLCPFVATYVQEHPEYAQLVGAARPE
jgi:predicted GNAT family acetyltransferase